MYPLLLLALATFVSEDLTCVAAGVLVAQAEIRFWPAAFACFTGILAGDMLLFAGGRYLRTFVSSSHVERAAARLEERGFMAVFASRFLPGSRLPLYVAAGLARVSLWRFAGYCAAAGMVWVPLLVALAAWLGRDALESALSIWNRIVILVLLALGLRLLIRFLLRRENRRRLLAFVLRAGHWEFWPAWAAYLPVVPYLLYLAVRYRSLSVFTAANPGIYSGGLVGESKSEILSNLDASGAVARWELISRPDEARRFMQRNELHYPIVLKPDIGERGAGVAIIRDCAMLEAYLSHASQNTIVQEYIPGVEFGVFYARGRIISITEKHFPALTGDGQTTLRDLILGDDRAVFMAPAYLAVHTDAATRIAADGERIQLVELGSHCRGAVFLSGMHHRTPALERQIEMISHSHRGFYFGRFDIRATSVEEFRAGAFKVIELNGVAAEPAHIYDPAVSLVDAYRALYRHWRLAFEIGAENVRRGAQAMSAAELLLLLWGCLKGKDRKLAAVQVEHAG
jgi:membrane protein DedA with SNARE-associated domain